MFGIDTAIIVESSPSMKKAQPTTSGTSTLSRGGRAAAAATPTSLTGAPPRYSAMGSETRPGRAPVVFLRVSPAKAGAHLSATRVARR